MRKAISNKCLCLTEKAVVLSDYSVYLATGILDSLSSNCQCFPGDRCHHGQAPGFLLQGRMHTHTHLPPNDTMSCLRVTKKLFLYTIMYNSQRVDIVSIMEGAVLKILQQRCLMITLSTCTLIGNDTLSHMVKDKQKLVRWHNVHHQQNFLSWSGTCVLYARQLYWMQYAKHN